MFFFFDKEQLSVLRFKPVSNHYCNIYAATTKGKYISVRSISVAAWTASTNVNYFQSISIILIWCEK